MAPSANADNATFTKLPVLDNCECHALARAINYIPPPAGSRLPVGRVPPHNLQLVLYLLFVHLI